MMRNQVNDHHRVDEVVIDKEVEMVIPMTKEAKLSRGRA